MAEEQRQYYSYLLRLWQVDGAGSPIWRASLEDPRTGERRGFADLESLVAFLKAQIEQAHILPAQMPQGS